MLPRNNCRYHMFITLAQQGQPFWEFLMRFRTWARENRSTVDAPVLEVSEVAPCCTTLPSFQHQRETKVPVSLRSKAINKTLLFGQVQAEHFTEANINPARPHAARFIGAFGSRYRTTLRWEYSAEKDLAFKILGRKKT